MRTFKLIIEYDGTNYVGWQQQLNGLSVQECLEKALATMTGEKVSVTGSGRTDAGVHAVGQVVSFRTRKKLPAMAFARGLQTLLPRDISVGHVEEVHEKFDARRDAQGKQYRYLISHADVPSALLAGRVWHLHQPLNVTAMRCAARHLVGCHDFSTFMASGSTVRHARRTIQRLTISTCSRKKMIPFTDSHVNHGRLIIIDVVGDGFLRNQVRNMVGTLVEVGEGKRTPQEMRELLRAKNRKKAGMCAPPQGLYLVKVAY